MIFFKSESKRKKFKKNMRKFVSIPNTEEITKEILQKTKKFSLGRKKIILNRNSEMQ